MRRNPLLQASLSLLIPWSFGFPILLTWIADQSDKQSVPQGSGYTLWSRLTSAASELSINVNQSWTSKLAVFNGEGM